MSLNLQPGTFGVFPASIAKGLDVYQQTTIAWLWFHKNNEGKAFPSISTLCKETSMSRQKMMETLTSLESLGLITKRKTKKDNGENGVNIYEIHCPEAMWRARGESGVVSTVDHVVSTVDQGVVSTADCNNTNILTRQNNNTPATPEVVADSAEVNEILSAFQMKLNPTINYGNKTQRAAVSDLLKLMGREKLIKTIEYAASVSSDQYAPTITTPYQLKEKMAQLVAYYQKQNNKKPNIISI